ncbi:MAG: hypothetical protein Q9184_007522, partial [Pyrenodesmia sp. 2 TL-2023]
MTLQEPGSDSAGGEQAKPDVKTPVDERIAAWKTPKLVTNLAEFMGSSATPVATKEVSSN